MLRIIKFELKKMYSQSIVIGSLVVLLLICLLLLQAYCYNNSSTVTIMPDGTKLSGRAAILYNQSIAKRYTGNFSDDTITQMVSDFSTDYPEEYYLMTESGEFNSSIPSAYWYLNMFIAPKNYNEIAQDAINHGTSIPPLTENGLISVHNYNISYIDKPLQYGYGDSWVFFFLGFCGSTITMAIPALIVIIIAISTIFSSEYNTKMDALILTTRYGKNKQIIAKLSACWIFTTILIGGLFIIFSIAFGVQYGLLGGSADIQTNFGLSLMAAEIPFNNLQLLIFGLIIVWFAGIFTAAVTAMLSSITKTPFSSLIVAFVLFVAPGIIRQILTQGPLRDIMIIFPVNAVNAQEVLLLPINVQSIFYGNPYAPAICIGIATFIITLFSSSVAYNAFRHHQVI